MDEEQTNLFKMHMHDVRPLRASNRIVHAPPQPFPDIRQRPTFNDDNVQQNNLSDEMDVERFLETDDTLSYRRNGVSLDTLKRLRRGHWATQAQIDLHGMHTDQARQAVSHFIDSCTQHDIRCVCIIHGKGFGSQGQPVLKDKVKRWLVQKNGVLAFCQASPRDGGSGALLLLLKAK